VTACAATADYRKSETAVIVFAVPRKVAVEAAGLKMAKFCVSGRGCFNIIFPGLNSFSSIVISKGAASAARHLRVSSKRNES